MADERRSRVKPNSRSLCVNWPATLIVALGAGFVFMRLGAPLPWVLGPIAICLLGALFGVVEKPPRWVIESARAMLGFAVGAAFTPAAVAALPGYAPSLAMVPVFLIIACGVGYVFFRRIAKFDRPTAFYSSAPGGLQDLGGFGEAAGGNLRALALAHATRVLLIVYFLPFWIEGVMGEAIGARAPSSVAVTDMAAFDWLALFACCGFGYWAAKRLKLAGAGVVGPMIVSALVHATGLVETKTPAELMIGAQLVLGATIGCFFVGLTVREFFGSISFSAIPSEAKRVAVTHFPPRAANFWAVNRFSINETCTSS